LRCGSLVLVTLGAQPLPSLPFAGDPPFPDSPQVYSQVEQRPCMQKDPATGAALLVCFAGGLGSKSSGKTCLWGVDYKDGQELNTFPLCTQDCVNAQLKPDNPCSAGCYAAFQGRVAWRSAGALDPSQQATLRKSYDDLITLVSAERAPARYKALGGDDKRKQLKQAIVSMIMRDMLSLNTYCAAQQGNAIAPDHFDYRTEYTAPLSRGVQAQGEAFVDLATEPTTQKLQIYESAFYEMKGKTYSAQNPDILAAEFLHEMVHWTQENYGYGQGRYMYLDPMHIAQSMLYELMDYDLCSQKAFYRRVLSDEQRRAVLTVGLEASAMKFNEVWGHLSDQQQKEIANWAWSLKDGWMRRAMLEFPGENHSVWGSLCTANKGSGPCGMVGNK
jgi:hypothetical protein